MKARKHLYIVVYDVVGNKRRTKISELLEKYGLRVNYSVFECMFTDGQLKKVQHGIAEIAHLDEDTIIYYPCCVNCYSKVVYQPCRRIAGPTIIVK